MPQVRVSGFTLAELLVAVLILGQIATFTIPKIISSQQRGQRLSTFKETIATLSQLAYTGHLLGDTSYFANNMNAVKVCTGDSTTQGCFSQATTLGEVTQPGFVLHNGATIAGFDYYNFQNGIVIDWNGAGPPNTHGDDQLDLMICFDNGAACPSNKKAGNVWTRYAASTTLYESIFQ